MKLCFFFFFFNCPTKQQEKQSMPVPTAREGFLPQEAVPAAGQPHHSSRGQVRRFALFLRGALKDPQRLNLEEESSGFPVNTG